MGMIRYTAVVLLVLLIFVASSFSGPDIEFDTTTADCGTVNEGETDSVFAAFTVRNSGDEDLRILRVLPGCGCTAVRFDPLIAPGDSSQLQARMSIKGYGTGEIIKGIAVYSNAANDSLVHIDMRVYVRPLVGVSSGYLDLISAGTAIQKTVIITSMKKDLQVTSLVFNPKRKMILKKRQMDIRFTFAPSDSVAGDGSHVFTLDIFPPAVEKWSEGTFELRTNHDHREKILLKGRIGR